MLALGAFFMIAIWLTSFWLIPLIFGVNYIESVTLVNILAACTPIQYLASSVGSTLVTQNNMKKKVLYMGIAALSNIIMNFILLPVLGTLGAAVSTLASSAILLIMYWFGAKKYVLPEKI